MTMVASQHVSAHQHDGAYEDGNNVNIDMDAPRFASLAVSCYAICTVFAAGGVWLRCISAALTSICVAPLFNLSWRAEGIVMQEATPEDTNQSSYIFTEASIRELENMREEEYSLVGRIVHRGIETWTEDVEDLVYVAQVLSESQGLLMLLLGGMSSMVLALVAGLDDVNVMKALFFSVTCYGITTVLVARSALRNGNQTNLCDRKPRLTYAEVVQIIEAIHEEDFVRNDELDYCDLPCLRNMLNSRKLLPQDAVTGTEIIEFISQDLETTKKNLIAALKLRRKYSDSCCICMDKFIAGDQIRVLPGCSHEFHNTCIDEWARTFAVNKMRIQCHGKIGNPSCPLCKTIIGNVQPCAPT